jgi:carbonic anhydrase
MSCPNATAPVDITNNSALNCDLKCNYNFNYPLTNVLTVSNRGEYLSIRVDKSDTIPVTFNADNYEIKDIRIYTPSLHTYGGSHADAEIIISHTNTSGGNNLLVCIPIIIGASSADTSSLFDSILSDVAKNANSVGNYTVVNSATFTLNKFIPMKPFYSYNGTLPYSPCNSSYNYVVFSKDESNVYMSQSAFNVLKKVIYANKYSTTTNNKKGLFYNQKGPSTINNKNKDGDIYIECLPTGSSGESLVPVPSASQTLSLSFSMLNGNTIFNNLFFKIFIGILVIYIIMTFGNMILNKISATQSGGGAVNLFKGGRKSALTHT